MEKKKHPILKGIAITLLVLLLLLLILAAVGFFFANSMFDKLDRTEITGDENLPEEEVYEEPTVDVTDSVEHIQEAEDEFEQIQQISPLETANLTNILLIGSDRRDRSENGRSDSMILVTLNHDTGKIHLTSFMRAMYVCIPKSSGDTWGMLNASYSWGGPQLLIKTIENNFRINIDNYVMVDLRAFEKAVDILGGVRINLTSAEAAHIGYNCGIPTDSGSQLLNGAQTRAYCQIRKTDNDFKRTERQREVIMLLMQKALNSDLERIMDLADQILPLVKTDLTNSDIFTYAAKALPMLQNPITQRMLPIENEAGKSYTGRIYVNGREMYKVDFETNIKALHEFMLS